MISARKRVANGLCRSCGEKRDGKSKVYCEKCREKYNQKTRKRRQDRIKKGICQYGCGDKIVKSCMCTMHLIRHHRSMSEYRKRKKQHTLTLATVANVSVC